MKTFILRLIIPIALVLISILVINQNVSATQKDNDAPTNLGGFNGGTYNKSETIIHELDNINNASTVPPECRIPIASNGNPISSPNMPKIYDYQYLAQTFRATQSSDSGDSLVISLYISKAGNPNGLVVELHNCSNNDPDTAEPTDSILGSVIITSNLVPEAANWVEVNLLLSSNMPANNMYAIVLRQDQNGGDSNNSYKWWYGEEDYVYGKVWKQSSESSGWTGHGLVNLDGTFKIYAIDDTPPVLTCPDDVDLGCNPADTSPTTTGTATAIDNYDPSPDISYDDSSSTNGCITTITRTWTATDDCGNSSSCNQIITFITDDTTPPVINCPADVTVECDASTDPSNTGSATASDNCDPNPVVEYSDETTPGDCPHEYTITRTWTATDACGNSSFCTQIITIADTTAPVLSGCPDDVTIECGADIPDPASVTATDNCDPDPAITSSESSAPGACPQEEIITRTWTATDACGNSSSCTQIITVVDTTTPVLSGCPDDVTVECGADIPDPASVTATDNCDPSPVVEYSDETTPGTCPQEYVITRTWTATDACGNSSSCSQIITVVDTTPPVISCPANIEIECDEISTDFGTATATDNCDPNPVVDYSDETTPGACPQEYVITRTWTATDACGNSSSCVQTITIYDDTPPVITCSPDITAECDADFGTATATDNCDPNPVIDYSDVTTPGACPQEYVITRTWTATDACGNSSSCVQTITIYDDTPPVITCPPDITAECDEIPADFGTAIAADNCDPNPIVNYSDVMTPGACPQEYVITRTWTATDACGNSSSCTQVITVVDTTAPVLSGCPDDVTVECGADIPAPATVTATDNCDPNPVVNYSDVTTPGACPQEYIITRTWTATDACGNSSNCTQIITVVDTTAPVLSGCPDDVTVECGADIPAPATVTATDNCDPNPVVNYSESSAPGACPQEEIITRTWTATDACGNSSSCSQTITVVDKTPPVISCPANLEIECDEISTDFGTATATDNCDPNPVVNYSDVTTPGTCPQEYVITRTWTATDACGNSSSCIQTITIYDDTPPVIICPPDITVECGADFGTATATDNCDPNPVVNYNDVTTPGDCPQEYVITRTWMATDACGNSSSCIQTITVVDTTAPVLSGCPDDVTIECGADIPAPATVTATDNCDPNPVVNYSDVTTPGACPQEYIITRTWTATDACGNSSSCTQIITVVDTTAPVLSGCPDDITIECDTDRPDPATVTATDNCDPNPVVNYSDVTTPGDCPQEYIITRTWTATDACGNSSSCTQIITVVDTTAPVLSGCPDDITIECDTDIPDPASVTATDNCDPNPTVDYSDVTTPGACPQEYIITRTWTATDACGNSSSCSQIITVVDTTPPVISCPANLEIECDESIEPINTGSATATDNCDPNPVVDYSDETTPGDCPQEYVITRTWTATDACGNSSSCTQIITIYDDTPPVISCPANIEIECDESTEPTNTGSATATDNCDPNPVVDYSDETTPGDCPQEYIITRTWTATDACGNSSSCTQIITVVDTTAPVLSGCPNDVTIECDADIPAPATVTATDSCDPNPTVTFNESSAPGTCPQEYVITRTWTATDACGNSSSCSQTITVVDTTAPVLNGCPDDVTVECDADIPAPATVTATDNCDPDPSVTFIESSAPGTCPQEEIITRTWTATDTCGNSSSCTQIITVVDTTPPVISCPANVEIECDESIEPTNTGSATATDNCDPNPVVNYSDETTPSNCPQEYIITRTWTATDACGNSSNCTQIITIYDDTPPVISCPADVEIECDESIEPTNTGSATATDNCGTPTVSYVDVDYLDGCNGTGYIERTWTATDDCGNSSSCTQIITVVDTTAPVLSGCPEDVTIECDADIPAPASVTATDNCDPDPVVTFNESSAPGTCPQGEIITRTWTATDACGNSDSCTQIITVVDTTAPVLSGCPDDVTVECDADIPAPVNVTATDNCDPDPTVTFSESSAPGTCPQEEIITRTWTATDACGNSSNCSQIITVVDTTPPVISCPDDITIKCGDSSNPDNTGYATATDNCDSTPTITYSDTVSGKCPDMIITRTWRATDNCGNWAECIQIITNTSDDTEPPIITCPDDITIECGDSSNPDNTGYATATDNCDPTPTITYSDTVSGKCPDMTITRTWRATDNCGNWSECTQIITNTSDDTKPPEINCPDDVTIECGESTDPKYTGYATAEDNCDPTPTITYSDTVSGKCPDMIITRTWRATDNCGNWSECIQIITNVSDDDEPPEITCPDDVTIDCGESIDPEYTGYATATDNCDPTPTITYSDKVSGECPNRTITRTWRATDDCGNSAECIQIITNVSDDTEPPEITCPDDVTIDCGESTDPEYTGYATATDNCDPTPTITYSDKVSGECPNRTITRTWRATDDCGNWAECTQIIMSKGQPPVTPTVFFTSASQTVAEDVGSVIVTTQLNTISGLNVTVPFTISGTATQGSDFTITSSPIVITAGSTSADITINIIDDTLYEASEETIIITMGAPTNAIKGSPDVHTITITDNDKPKVSFTSAGQTVVENIGSVSVTAKLEAIYSLDVTVPFTISGTATEGDDYTIDPSPIIIPAGSTSADITISIIDDILGEDDETIVITMGDPTNAIKGSPDVHTITITDNDGGPAESFLGPEEEYFTVDFLGKITQGLLDEDGKLVNSLFASSPDESHLFVMDAGTLVMDEANYLVTLIKIKEADEVPALPSNTVLLGQLYDFLPSGIVLSQPSSLTLSYDPNQIPKNVTSIGLACYNADTGWEFLTKEAGTTAEVGKISAPVEHFTAFGVLAEVEPEVQTITPAKQTWWTWWWLIPILAALAGILFWLFKKLNIKTNN